MSPFGAASRNRGSRKPVAYNSILNPGGTLGCASAGRSTTCGRLIARAFEPGGGKSWTVILRITPGASLVQSPIAALPVRTVPFSPTAPVITAAMKIATKKIARKIGSLNRRAFISVKSFGRQYRAASSRLPRKYLSQRHYSSCVFQQAERWKFMSKKMRVVQVPRAGGPLELVERDIPEPERDWVRVKVEACGVCHSDSL